MNKINALILSFSMSIVSLGANAQGAESLSGIIGFPVGSLTFAPFASPDLLLPNVVNLIGTGASLDPAVLLEIGSGLGLQLLDTLVPSLAILQSSPDAFPAYILMDGGLLASDSALALVPSIPLLNSPLQGF